MSVKIDLAIDLLTLSKNSLTQLNNFVNEFNAFLRHIEERKSMFKSDLFDLFDVYEFVEYTICKTGVLKQKSKVKLSRRFNYNCFIKNYEQLLREILCIDNMFLHMYSEFFWNYSKEYADLIEYLSTNYDKKDMILEKLWLIKEYGLTQFDFVPFSSLDGKYSVGFLINRHLSKEDKNVYFVKDMICSDGTMKWQNQLEEDVYNVCLSDANYVILYTKGSNKLDKMIMKICNFDFDIESLPTLNELTDVTVIPNIDFDVVRKKSNAVNLNYLTIMAMDKAYELKTLNVKMDIELKKVLYGKELCCFLEDFVNTDNYLECVNVIRTEVIDDYIDNGIISRSELGVLTKEKKELEDNKNNYYSRRKKRRFK